MQTNAIAAAKRYAGITLGCLIYAAAVALFLDPNKLAPGGVTGIAVMLSRSFGISTGTLTLLLNLPLLALGLWKFGRGFLFSTVYATVLSSVMINWLAPIGALTGDCLLAGVAGGALMAVGLGVVFKCGATTGGTDILVKLLRLKYRYIKTGAFFAVTDTLIVAASALAFKNMESALYAGIALGVSSVLLDIVLYGPDEAKMVFIISDNAKGIAARILRELDVGATYLTGRGAYSGDEKQVLLCAVRKQLFPNIRTIVKDVDPAAFMIVSSATEIYGEGFKDHFTEEL